MENSADFLAFSFFFGFWKLYIWENVLIYYCFSKLILLKIYVAIIDITHINKIFLEFTIIFKNVKRSEP